MNPSYLIDAYKIDHRRMYPPGITKVYSNFTPRYSLIPGITEVCFFGLQGFLQEFLADEFAKWFTLPESDVVDRYERRTVGVLGSNQVGVDHIRDLHRLGYLPLEFKAVPEGTMVPLQVPMFTVENTLPEFFWLTNYIESLLSAEIWGPITSATLALRLRRLCDDWSTQTNPEASDFVDWQCHDFSFRGMSSVSSAQKSGAGHLLAFAGTDTMPALDWIEDNYGARGFIGGSVPATEHSVMSAGGKESEQETFARLLALYPSGVVSVVSDTWDLWNVLTVTLPALKSEIMARDGKLVVRPDSGDPVDILCGDPSAGPGTPASKGVVELLWETFGGTVSSTGFRQLDTHIGVIYGDSINYDRAGRIFERLAAKGFASTNVVLGIGSFTYQFQTRDVFGMAMKATWAEIDGVGVDLFKDPITGKGDKKSARGRLAVVRKKQGGKLELVQGATAKDEEFSLLETVWKDGKFVKLQKWEDIVKTVGVRKL